MSDEKSKKVKCWACGGTGVKSYPGNGTPGTASSETCTRCGGTGLTDPYVPPGPDEDVIIGNG